MRWLILMLWMPAFAIAGEPAIRSEFTVFPAVVQFNDIYVDQAATAAVWSWHLAERFAATVAGSASWDARESRLQTDVLDIASEWNPSGSARLTAWTALAGVELTTGEGSFEVFEHGPLRVRALVGVELGARGSRVLLGSGSFADTGPKLLLEGRLGLRFAITSKLGIAVQLSEGVSSYDVRHLNGCDSVELQILYVAQQAGRTTPNLISSSCRPEAFTRPKDLAFARDLNGGYAHTPPEGIVSLATFGLGLFGVF